MSIAIVTHGGAGAPQAWQDGCRKATVDGFSLLQQGGSSFDAVLLATISMENDGRFNAGSGSKYRLDGKTIQMDASVMRSDGAWGAVIGIEHVQNPVLVASKVLETPHRILVGEGAFLFAERNGFQRFHHDSKEAKRRYEKMIAGLSRKQKDAILRFWNFPSAPPDELTAHDTVGAVARDAEGKFAVALSTGGAKEMMNGRAGDTGFMGAGFKAGAYGAVAATGIGERIMDQQLASVVYEWIADGMNPQAACRKGVELFDASIPIGLIAVSKLSTGAYSNTEMPHFIEER